MSSLGEGYTEEERTIEVRGEEKQGTAKISPLNGQNVCVAGRIMSKRGMGKVGFVHPDRLPTVGDAFQDGSIGYHLRGGKHYLSREDWQKVIAYMKKHLN